uniref:Cytochrome B6-f complex subunit n=1 Tax=Porphyridium sordidum TaxID=28024 RepID=A0A1C9CDZ7_PORSO|nr:cytochrome B6-f complex subunit [Porphyridium sordidum]AOM66623.1 cytochrome B6-f complex subunit [Porphyridium sordidum]
MMKEITNYAIVMFSMTMIGLALGFVLIRSAV